MTTDRLDKTIVLRAPHSRVWRALTDSTQFGTWFGVKFDAPFAPGVAMRGTIVGTKMDPDVASKQQAHAEVPFDITIEHIEPEHLFSFRWRPFAIEPGVDYSNEPTTLVSFRLEDVEEGVRLTISEVGFDGIPLARRAQAFAANGQGWAIQLTLIERYLVSEYAIDR